MQFSGFNIDLRFCIFKNFPGDASAAAVLRAISLGHKALEGLLYSNKEVSGVGQNLGTIIL